MAEYLPRFQRIIVNYYLFGVFPSCITYYFQVSFYRRVILHETIITQNATTELLQSLHMSQVAHQAGAYPGILSMKRLQVNILPLGWDASPSQGYPQH